LHDLAHKGYQLKKNIQREVLAVKISKKRNEKNEFADKMNAKFKQIKSTVNKEHLILGITGHANVRDLAKDLFEVFALFELLFDQQFNPANNSSAQKAAKPPTSTVGRFIQLFSNCIKPS